MNREKRTASGPLLEIDLYPIFENGTRVRTRAPKTKRSTVQQAAYNRLLALKKLIRKVNANFGREDYWMTITYDGEHAPACEEAARRDLVNYLRRVKHAREKALRNARADLREATDLFRNQPDSRFLKENVRTLQKRVKLLKTPLKYIYCLERVAYKKGKMAGKDNYHVHMFISGGLPQTEMERLWTKSARVKCDGFKPHRFGPEAAAVYMHKDPQGRKSFVCSRNLSLPVEKTRDGKYSNRQVERIATQRLDEAKWWEQRYPGYRLLRTYARWNEYNSHWYVTAVMYKADDIPPDWSADQWLTEDLV